MKCIYYGSWHFSWNMLDISVWNSTTSGKNHYCLITTCYSDDSKKKYITSTKNRLCSLGKPLMFNAVPYNTWISKCMIYRSKHGLILCFRGIFSTDMFAFLVYKTVVNSEELVIAQRNKQDATHHLRRYVPGRLLLDGSCGNQNWTGSFWPILSHSMHAILRHWSQSNCLPKPCFPVTQT